MTLSAEELYRRGVDHGNAGRNAAARRALTTALERTDEPDLRARIAGTLAYIAARTGDPAGADALCRDALALDGVTPATAAVLWGQLGVLAVGRGDWDTAVDWLDRAIDGVGEDPAHRNRMYLNRSVAHMQAGRLAQARSDLERAAADYAAVGGERDLAMVRHNLGYVALLEGDLVSALNLMTAAREVLQGVSPVASAIGELDLAEVLRDAGLATEAERTLARLARVFGAHGMRQARGEAEHNLARALLVHDPAGAAKVARAAARRFRALGSTSWLARADAVRLRADLARGARPAAAEVAGAAAELERLGFAAEATALRLTRQLWDPGADGDQPRLPSAAPIQLRLLAREVRAARALAAGDHAGARRQAAHGLDELAGWQASFGSLDLQTSITMHGTGLATRGVAAALRSGSAAAVFEWSERARHLSQQVVPLRPPPDPDLAADLAELRALRADNPGADWLAGPRATRLRERARHRQWTSTGAARVAERIGLAGLREHLDADSAFVTYLFDGTNLGCLAVTAGTARVVAPPGWPAVADALAGLRADLEVSAALAGGPMAARVERALQERLATLDRLLLAGVLPVVGDRRVVLTAPGVLAGVPWAMLPSLRGRPVTLATSATRWVADQGRSPAAGVGLVAGPGIARAGEEVARAAAAWRAATELREGEATVAGATRLAGEVGILHIASHGRHAVDNPLFSGLELTDGTLFGYDIDQMPRVPDVVVLSACEVGRSAVRWGEEAIGMTRAWLHAGAACVVAAPVVVADDLACELLGAMHAGLASGRSPAEALAQVGVPAPFLCHGAGF